MQALKCKIMHHKPVHKLEHDILPRDLLQLKYPPHPKQKKDIIYMITLMSVLLDIATEDNMRT